MARWQLAWPLAVSLTVIVAACGTAGRREPLLGPTPQPPLAVAQGERLFMRHCHACHPGGEAGLAPAITNKPLPSALIRLQVRQGLGDMPAFDTGAISDKELDDLLAYIQALRAARP